MTREYSLEEGRQAAALRKRCPDEDAHTEHMWWERGTHWYCQGFLSNILRGIQDIMDRIDALERGGK